MTPKELRQLEMARIVIRVCRNHLEACEAGRIIHPCKSASLPLVLAWLAEFDLKEEQ